MRDASARIELPPALTALERVEQTLYRSVGPQLASPGSFLAFLAAQAVGCSGADTGLRGSLAGYLIHDGDPGAPIVYRRQDLGAAVGHAVTVEAIQDGSILWSGTVRWAADPACTRPGAAPAVGPSAWSPRRLVYAALLCLAEDEALDGLDRPRAQHPPEPLDARIWWDLSKPVSDRTLSASREAPLQIGSLRLHRVTLVGDAGVVGHAQQQYSRPSYA